MPDLKQRFSLYGKSVLVTGATGYLGRAMVFGLAELGAKVLVNGRNRPRVEQFVEELCEAKLAAQPAVFDVNDEQAVRHWFAQFGNTPLHGLVNNAYAGGAGSIETATDNDYRNS